MSGGGEVRDFRSSPMDSPEGEGRARSRWQQAWDVYAEAVRPLIEPPSRRLAGRMAVDLVGFWVAWHLHGGFEGLRQLGMSRSAIYRRIGAFRQFYGEHPDTYQLPGVTLDVEAYLRSEQPAAATEKDTPEEPDTP